jgi:hypothetical protein
MSTHDLYDSFGSDLDSELDALEQDIDFTDSSYGAVGIYGRGARYGAASMATVDIDKLAYALIYPGALKSVTRVTPDFMDPVKQNAVNLANEIARAISLHGYPATRSEQAEFMAHVSFTSILPDLDDSASDEVLHDLKATILANPDVLESLRAAVAAGPSYIVAWYTEDLPALISSLMPMTENQVVNEYAAYLSLLSIAGFDVFEEIAQAAAANGAIITNAPELGPGPGSWEPESSAPPKSGILGDVQPATILGVGYLLTIGIPAVRAIF